MRQRIRLLATVLVTLLLLLPYGTLQAETVKLTGTDYPPFIFAEPLEGLRGFDVEVVEEAFKRVQVSTVFKYSPWNRALLETKLGLFTGIFNCSYKQEREEFLIYSESIGQQTVGFFVRSDFNGFEPSSIQDAKGLRVGAILGWAMADTMKGAGADLVTYRTEKLLFRDLLKGVVDYAYLSLESSGFGAMQLGISKELRTIKVQEKKLYVCFSKKWPDIEALVLKFNEGLAAVRADGTYDRIHSKYR